MTKAAQAKTDTDKATDEEEVRLAVLSSIGTEGEIELATLQNEMQAIGGTVTPTDGTFPVTVTKGSYKMEVTQTGNLEKPAQKVKDIAGTKLEETTKVRDVNGDVAYVPGGYIISDVITDETAGTKTEQEIKRGLVIKDEAQNEWVWVPVSKSELTTNMIDSGSATLCDSSTTTSKYSKIWNFNSTGREIYSRVSGSYTYKAGIPGQSYDSTTKTFYYREPDVLTDSTYADANSSYYNTILNENTKNLTVDITQKKSLNMLAQQFVNDYNNMVLPQFI